MLETFRRAVGFRVARFHFRKAREHVIAFSGFLSSAERALLIMPLHEGEFLPTVMVVELLRNRFHEENITIVTTEHSVEVMRIFPRSQVIRILPSDIDAFFLPRQDVLERVKSHTFDVAIDLNLDFLLPSGYICRASNARVRVGVSGKRADSFYNFQIRRYPGTSRQHVYDQMTKCLQMF